MEEPTEMQGPTLTTENVEDTTESRKLKLSEVKVFETLTQTLYDSGGITDVMNIALCNKLGVHPRPTTRLTPMVDIKEAVVVMPMEWQLQLGL